MSLDRSLKSANALVRHRNVLTRAERLDVLAEQEKWNDTKPVFGLPKVAHRKMAVAKAVSSSSRQGRRSAHPARTRAALPRTRRRRSAPVWSRNTSCSSNY